MKNTKAKRRKAKPRQYEVVIEFVVRRSCETKAFDEEEAREKFEKLDCEIGHEIDCTDWELIDDPTPCE